MALITELDVINRCLATMGELPINSLASTLNPMVTSARQVFKDVAIEEQSPGWWFNSESLKLYPESPNAAGEGIYKAPSDTLSLDTKAGNNPSWLALRGSTLYDVSKGEPFRGTREITVHIIRLINFDDLPYNAQRLIRDAVVMKFQADFEADELKIQLAEARYTEAYGVCMADHTRAVGANMLYKGSAGSALARSRIPYSATRRWNR